MCSEFIYFSLSISINRDDILERYNVVSVRQSWVTVNERTHTDQQK